MFTCPEQFQGRILHPSTNTVCAGITEPEKIRRAHPKYAKRSKISLVMENVFILTVLTLTFCYNPP